MDTLQSFIFHVPSKEDGWAVSRLISECPPLDNNSVYCSLLQCHHFAHTSVAVKRRDELVGFISGYLVPGKTDTLFIWQVAVSQTARGNGLASQMIDHILSRENCQAVRFIETTITEDNKASWALFQRVADNYASPLSREILFDQNKHFIGHHDSEFLVKIGPLNKRTLSLSRQGETLPTKATEDNCAAITGSAC